MIRPEYLRRVDESTMEATCWSCYRTFFIQMTTDEVRRWVTKELLVEVKPNLTEEEIHILTTGECLDCEIPF
jgi:hypothetical protein